MAGRPFAWTLQHRTAAILQWERQKVLYKTTTIDIESLAVTLPQVFCQSLLLPSRTGLAKMTSAHARLNGSSAPTVRWRLRWWTRPAHCLSPPPLRMDAVCSPQLNAENVGMWYGSRCAARRSVAYRVGADPNLCPATQVERQRFRTGLRVQHPMSIPCRCRGTGYERAGSCLGNAVAAGSVRNGDRLVR